MELCPHAVFELSVTWKPVLFATLSASAMLDAGDERDNYFSPETLQMATGNLGSGTIF